MPKATTKEKLTIRLPGRQTSGDKVGGGSAGTSSLQTRSVAGDAMDVDGRHCTRRAASNPLTGSFAELQAESFTACQPLVVAKEYCSFCGDLAGERVHVCKDCGAYVCEQTKRHGRGCIYIGTVLPNDVFRCPVCNAKHWRGLSELVRPNGGLPVSKPIRSTPNAGVTGSVTVRLHWLCRQEASEANLAPGPGEHDALHQPRELHRRFAEAGPQAHLSGGPTERESSRKPQLIETLNAWGPCSAPSQ